MNREQMLKALKAHEQELRAAGVARLSLFGSVARDEKDPHDVDVAVRLDESFSRPGFDFFRRLEDLERRLSQILGCKVDVIEEPAPQQSFQQEIDRERTVAF